MSSAVPEKLLTDVCDADLFSRIRAGDPEALEAWFHRNKDALYSFVYFRVGGDADLAADALQSTFTVALPINR